MLAQGKDDNNQNIYLKNTKSYFLAYLDISEERYYREGLKDFFFDIIMFSMLCQSPLNTGFLFSINAAVPSFLSLLEKTWLNKCTSSL